MLYLFSEGAQFRGAKGRLLILEEALHGTVDPLVGRHSFGGGAYLVLLVSKFAHDRLARCFVPAELGGSRSVLRRSGLLRRLPSGRGIRLVGKQAWHNGDASSETGNEEKK